MFYRAIVAYDGTDYAGWQIQPDQPTIAEILEKTFKQVFFLNASIVGASRTDAGVHALGQVIRIETPLDLDPKKILYAWNNYLPQAIAMRALERCEDTFHPQNNVKQKIYWYHIFNQRPLPFFARYGYFYARSYDLQKFEQALKVFKGTYDFRSFSTGDEYENTMRTIDDISLNYLKRLKVYQVQIKGERFLHFMIRRIVGACLQIASDNQISINYLLDVLAQRDSEQALFKAPAQGLMLAKIKYK